MCFVDHKNISLNFRNRFKKMGESKMMFWGSDSKTIDILGIDSDKRFVGGIKGVKMLGVYITEGR